MPTNLPPEYYHAEARYKAASSPEERVASLEALIATVPKHKGTDKLRADLRKRLSKLKSAESTPQSTSHHVSAFHIDPEGAGQVVIVGAPNVGKSSLLAALTNAEPEIGQFPFTTWGPTPGMMDFENVQIQLIDTPPLSEEYIEPTLFDLLRRADLIMLVVDIQSAPAEQLELSLDLLKAHWIVPTQLRETVTDRRFVPKPFLLVGTKHDSAADDELLEIVEMLLDARWLPLLTVSAETGHHLDDLRRAVYDKLGIMRIYSKPPLADADLTSPFVLPKESTVETFAAKVHRDFYDNLKSARVWGSGAFDGQMVSRDYVLADGDVVELRT